MTATDGYEVGRPLAEAGGIEPRTTADTELCN